MFAPYTSLILVAVIFFLLLAVFSYRDSTPVEPEDTSQTWTSGDLISHQTYEQSGRPKWCYLNQ